MKKETIKTIKGTLVVFIKDDDGSSVVELCLIFPMIIWTIFFVIYLFMGELNEGIATGQIYEKLYNKEAYIYGDTEQTAYEEALENSLDTDIKNSMSFMDNMVLSVKLISSGEGVVQNLKKFDVGNLQISVSYEEEYPGISNLIQTPLMHKTITGSQEIRDTGNNLRRWQLYGEILPD